VQLVRPLRRVQLCAALRGTAAADAPRTATPLLVLRASPGRSAALRCVVLRDVALRDVTCWRGAEREDALGWVASRRGAVERACCCGGFCACADRLAVVLLVSSRRAASAVGIEQTRTVNASRILRMRTVFPLLVLPPGARRLVPPGPQNDAIL
jgi:hypothetical protein